MFKFLPGCRDLCVSVCAKANIVEKTSLEEQGCNQKLMSLSLDWTCNVLKTHVCTFHAVKNDNFCKKMFHIKYLIVHHYIC